MARIVLSQVLTVARTAGSFGSLLRAGFSSVAESKSTSLQRYFEAACVRVPGLEKALTVVSDGDGERVEPLINPHSSTGKQRDLLGQFFTGDLDVEASFTKGSPTLEELARVSEAFEAGIAVRATHDCVVPLGSAGLVYYSISPAYNEVASLWAQGFSHSDRAMIHYRGLGFRYMRALAQGKVDGVPRERLDQEIQDVMLGYACSKNDPNGGFHQVLASKELGILTSTPSIGTQCPPFLAMAMGIAARPYLGMNDRPAMEDSEVPVMSMGDGSTHHPWALSMFNTARDLRDKGVPSSGVVVVEDNGVAIATLTKWERTARNLRAWGFPYISADACDPLGVLRSVRAARRAALNDHTLAILHLSTDRRFGHSKSERDHRLEDRMDAIALRDPLMHWATFLEANGIDARETGARLYREKTDSVARAGIEAVQGPTLSREDVLSLS